MCGRVRKEKTDWFYHHLLMELKISFCSVLAPCEASCFEYSFHIRIENQDEISIEGRAIGRTIS